jgi:hypothetical protein
LANPPATEAIEKVLWIRQIAQIPEPTKIGAVGPDGCRIVIRPHEHSEASIRKSEAQPSGSAEEIDRCGPLARRRADPSTNGSEVCGLWSIRMWWQLKIVSPVMGNRRYAAKDLRRALAIAHRVIVRRERYTAIR